MKYKKVGLIGEDPTDTIAIANLLYQRYNSTDFHFYPLARNQTGSAIFNDAAIRSYNFEIDKKAPDLVIFITDADAVVSEHSKIEDKKKKYNKVEKAINCKVILLLNIYELEALILADIDSYNIHFKQNVAYSGNVLHQSDPKAFLKNKTNPAYHPNRCPEIFDKLNINTIIKRCSYFATFISKLDQSLQYSS